ncbi:Formamidopyrimidine-DNA glycosylase N-terminal domain-containing protein [Usnea florida]
MPEIGEVARIVSYIHKHLVGKTLAKVKAQHDENVYGKVGCSAEAFEKALTGKKVLDAKQQGKYFWMVMSSPPHPLMHFGMAGWLKIRDEETAYYKPAKPEESPQWPPKYWKFVLETAEEPKREAAFVDLRRFARIRLIDCAADQIRNVSPLVENGPDPVIDKGVVTEEWLAEKLGSKRVPVKALLLDQQNISGIGNWVGDEIMYDAKIHPEQYSNTLTPAQIKQLHKSIHYICSFAVDNLADSSKFPEEWLFKHRWGKGKKDSSTTLPNGSRFVYLTVGGRTSCVVPSVQKKTGPVAGDVKDEAGTEDADGEKKAKIKSSKKAPKPKKEEAEEAEKEEAKPAKESSKGNKRTAKTVDEEPAVNGHKPNEEASKPASKKRKANANANANANGAVESKKQSKGNAGKNETGAKSEPEKSERRRSGRISGKAA